MAKASAKPPKTGKTKKEQLDTAISDAVGAGVQLELECVDFSDPQRPKTCLEVDFPILLINHVAVIEGNAGKPVYQMSKWWARRRSSVFRATLIAAATKAPDDHSEAARLVWDSYYGNHQKNEALRRLKVADIFMGGGTTIVEGSRLGMQMFGNDLNPVAWFVVKNEVSDVSPVEVQRLLDEIESTVKPAIMPYYACDCPRGHTGKWTQRSTGRIMDSDFNPLLLTQEERLEYDYNGPEVIYTFWAKHGPCQATGCDHRTPIMPTPVVAVKTLTVTSWPDRNCVQCRRPFDIEQHVARMAPAAMFVCTADEKPYASMGEHGIYACPHCGHEHQDQNAYLTGKSTSLGKETKKSIVLTVLVHPDWLKGSPGKTDAGVSLGGTATDDAESTERWYVERQKTLKIIEVRGKLPTELECPDTREVFRPDTGTVPRKSTFTCMEATCGKQWDVLESVKHSQKTGPIAMYAIQGYCPTCDARNLPYSGRFFDLPDSRTCTAAQREWSQRCEDDLAMFWPRSELPYGFMTHHLNGGIPNHGFTHWWKMFNARQLLVHTQLLKAVVTIGKSSSPATEAVLGAFQQYLRNQNMFCIWNQQADKLEPMFSNNNFHPKSTVVENSVFSRLGRGNWESCSEGILEGLAWCSAPWEAVPAAMLTVNHPSLAERINGKSAKVFPGDPLTHGVTLTTGSSTALPAIADSSLDLIITDPPFGGLLHYSELADFFYVWLRLVLKQNYPQYFTSDYTPKALEAVANRARQPDNPDKFYQKILTECWKEAGRTLKPAGLLAFTFHHSEDEPWVAVLESLFDAGFYLEATYPIRSDETKGDGEFGSRKIEFDIIHVCRKRIEEPTDISWARLRRQIVQDVQQLQHILEHHQEAGLQQADLQVIRRGKALEYFSKHYGKVFVERGREFTIREALAGINQLLDDQQDARAEVPPVEAEPYTRQFLRLFTDTTSVPRDQLQKYLRGTGISPTEFEERGWCVEIKKVFHLVSALEFAQKWKGKPRQGLGRDLDQALFMIGGCCDNSGIRVQDTLNSERFQPHVATGLILDWFTRHGGDTSTKDAAKIARKIYTAWEAANEKKLRDAQRTFDFLEVE